MTFGPVTWQELREMATSRELLPSDVVGQIGMARTMRARTVSGLFDLLGGSDGDGRPGDLVETIGTGVPVGDFGQYEKLMCTRLGRST